MLRSQKCSYFRKGFHPKDAYMNKNLDEMNLPLERNNINLPESVWKRDNDDRDIQQERGHALMEIVSNPKSLLIDSRASNHMMERKESFSSLDNDKSIPTQMGDDSEIISKGKGIVKLEHGMFFYVLYVPSLPSHLLSVFQMTHTGVPNRVNFISNDMRSLRLHQGNLLQHG